MVLPNSSRRDLTRKNPEAGYILLGVLILMALFIIGLAVAAPIVAKQIERDKEVEAVQRGKQYTRAIKLYYKRFGAYPSSIKQLENTNNIRYLRKHYLDPITGKDDWRLIHVGEAKVPVMGFFGQPLQAGTGSATTGILGNGTGGVASAGNAAAFGGSPASGGSSAFGGGFSSTSSSGTGDGTAAPAAPVGVLPGSSAGSGAGVPTTGDAGSGPTFGGASLGSPSTTGTGNGVNGSTTGSTGSGFGSGFGSSGPIVGVGIPVNKKSIVVYHKQDAFNKWEFTYDPIQDQMVVSSSSIPGSTPAGSLGGSGTGSGLGSGSSTGIGNNPFGGTNSPGSTTSGGGNPSAPTSTPQ